MAAVGVVVVDEETTVVVVDSTDGEGSAGVVVGTDPDVHDAVVRTRSKHMAANLCIGSR
ncbi:MAG: hypothetical protein ACN4GK_10855 [Acidimicrobiia bacterium]